MLFKADVEGEKKTKKKKNGTKQKDSYTGHPLPFPCHDSSPRVTAVSLRSHSPVWTPVPRQCLSSPMSIKGRAGGGDLQAQPDGHIGKEGGNEDQDAEF